jgi:hypothetical protein
VKGGGSDVERVRKAVDQSIERKQPMSWSQWLSGPFRWFGGQAHARLGVDALGSVKDKEWTQRALEWGVNLGFFNPRQTIDNERWRLYHFSGSTARASAARVTAIFSRDVLLHSLRYPSAQNHDNPAWTEKIGLAGKQQSRLGKTLRWAATHQTDFLTDTIEAIVLRGAANLSNRIHSKTVDRRACGHYDKHFSLDLLLAFLRHSQEHLQQLNRAEEAVGVNQGSERVLKEMGTALHAAIPRASQGVPAAWSRQLRWEKFYLPVAKQLLAIMFPQGSEELPAPYGFREVVWDQLEQTILPEVLERLVGEVLHPKTLNKILLSSLQQLNAEGDVDSEVPNAFKRAKDPRQRELETLCSCLLKEGATQLSPSLSAFLLRPSVLHSAGVSLAAQLREALSQWPLDRLLDEALFTGLPKWLPGHWECPKGTPQKAFMMGDELLFVPHEPVEFHFARTASEEHGLELNRLEEAEALQREVLREVSRLVRRSLKTFFPNLAKRLWRPIDQWLYDLFKSFFGRSLGPSLKQGLSLGLRLLSRICLSFLSVLTWPLLRLGDVLLRRLMRTLNAALQRRRPRQVLESLIFHCVEEVLGRLKR